MHSTVLNAYSKGCREALVDFTRTGTMIIGWVVLGVAAIELVGFIFACCLANNIISLHFAIKIFPMVFKVFPENTKIYWDFLVYVTIFMFAFFDGYRTEKWRTLSIY